MKPEHHTPYDVRKLKRLLAVTGLGVVVTMGALTASVNGSPSVTGNTTTIADTTTSSTPPSTPSTPSAAPTTKATPFQGGDWPNR